MPEGLIMWEWIAHGPEQELKKLEIETISYKNVGMTEKTETRCR